MNYCCITYQISDSNHLSEILIAQLSELGYDMFEEGEGFLKAYIQETSYNEVHLVKLMDAIPILKSISFKTELIPHQNWNALWESNYEPILIADKVYVYASFHPRLDNIEYPILVQPKMSFGTGHHDTTRLMISQMLKLDFENKSVLDLGSGTGVLAILTEKMGAKWCLAIDNDRNCAVNAVENCLYNNCSLVTVLEGDINNLGNSSYDIILANINKNVILQYLPELSYAINKNGLVIVSGFYEEDLFEIENKANENQLKLSEKIVSNNWCSARFKKLI